MFCANKKTAMNKKWTQMDQIADVLYGDKNRIVRIVQLFHIFKHTCLFSMNVTE